MTAAMDDQMQPLRTLIQARRKEARLSRPKVANRIAQIPGSPADFDFLTYLKVLELGRRVLPVGDEAFWYIARILSISEEQVLDSIMDGVCATISPVARSILKTTA